MTWEISDCIAQQDNRGQTGLCACVDCRVTVFISLWLFPQPSVPLWLPAILLSVAAPNSSPHSKTTRFLIISSSPGVTTLSLSLKRKVKLFGVNFFGSTSHSVTSLVWEDVPPPSSRTSALQLSEGLCRNLLELPKWFPRSEAFLILFLCPLLCFSH